MPANQHTSEPQYVQAMPRPIKKVKEKPRKSRSVTRTVINILLLTVLVLFILFVTSVVWLGSAWLQTYRALTQETVVAKVTISEVRYDSDGNPYLEIWYMPNETESALQGWLGLGGEAEEVPSSFTLPGDAFRVQGDFFKWGDKGTLIGLKPMYRITRATGDYIDIDDYNTLPHEAHELNSGSDSTWTYVKDHSEDYTWFGTAYTSSAGQNGTSKERDFNLIATEDGLILREVD